MRPSFLLLPACAALAACSSPESQTRAGLIKAGLSPKMAACMAPRMADRLSITQLRQLAAIGKASGGAGGKDGATDVLKRLRELDDPQIVSVVSSSAALCATGFTL
ncbi:hypothetical protein ACFOKI_00835 [Sphingomonas qilianensis]|uniref:Lipoprotein n=1 Tax=Sphingomonas qilianensis TaxID=1736690 RepID=A0ABU9XW77_9SPHN